MENNLVGGFPFTRTLLTGILIGISYHIPHIPIILSLFAFGYYYEFVGNLADIFRIKLSKRNIGTILLLSVISVLTAYGLKDVVPYFSFNFRAEMMAIYVGISFGTAISLYNFVRPIGKSNTFVIILVILSLYLLRTFFYLGAGVASPIMFFFAGLFIGVVVIFPVFSIVDAMLVAGLYLPFISLLSDLRTSYQFNNHDLLMNLLRINVVPLVLGFLVGIFILSNAVKFSLKKQRGVIISVLIGILLSNIGSLYPFNIPRANELLLSAKPLGDSTIETKVIGRNWTQEEIDPVYKMLKRTESSKFKIKILDAKIKDLNKEDLEYARSSSAALLLYDREISPDLINDAKGIQIITIPNVEYTHDRLVLVIISTAAAFVISFLFGAVFVRHLKLA